MARGVPVKLLALGAMDTIDHELLARLRLRAAVLLTALIICCGLSSASEPVNPVPPELVYASDSLRLAIRTPLRAKWALQKLDSLEARLPRSEYLAELRLHALITLGAPPRELSAQAESTLCRMYPAHRDHYIDNDRAHVCIDVAEALLRRRALPEVAGAFADTALQLVPQTGAWVHQDATLLLAESFFQRGLTTGAINAAREIAEGVDAWEPLKNNARLALMRYRANAAEHGAP